VSGKYKYNEDQIIQQLSDYIDATYDAHYSNDDVQTIDVWRALGIEKQSCQSNIIKYVMRYGKKDGLNKKDLLKIMHYTILLWHFTEKDDS
jgi:hypothetical protein